MLFNTFLYFIFLLAFLVAYHLVKKSHFKKLLLIIASYGFYAYWDYRFCLLLATLSLISFYLGKNIERDPGNRTSFSIGIAFNIVCLFSFKYFNFFIESFESAFLSTDIHLGFTEKNLIFPLGLSFYTLQSIAYLIDVKRGDVKAASILDVFTFLAFFPKLVAGPLVKSQAFLMQLQSDLKVSRQQIETGLVLIISGLFRKVLIADPCSKIVDNIFKQPEYFLAPEILCASILFVIQIYADFSGYTFIARGSAKLLGIEMMKNFNHPLFSRNLINFWRRWHVSLADWFRDYLYFPLNNFKRSYSFFPIMIVAVIGGLWHGADWNFIIWGVYNGIIIWITSKIIKHPTPEDVKVKVNDIPSIFLTFILLLVGWFIYRLNSIEDLAVILNKFTNWQVSDVGGMMAQITFIIVFAMFVIEIIEYVYRSGSVGFLRNKYLKAGAMLAMLGATLLYMFQTEPSPFVYFQF